MSVNEETLRVLRDMRTQVGVTVDAATADLVRAWVVAWDEVADAWDVAMVDLALVSAGQDGRWPTRVQLARAQRAQQALDVTRAQLIALAEQVGVRVSEDLPELVDEAADWHARMTASQLPAVDAADRAALAVAFNRVDPLQLEAIVARTTERITSLTLPLSVDAMATVQATLIRGMAIGDNPRRTASQMVARVRGAFDGGLNRALVIARTETLDAHRAAGQETDRANSDVLAGWTWAATLDTRTCPSCWSKHGTRYGVEDPGPWDHQQGRCARLPVTRSWRDLGFDLDEPASLLPDAQTVFAALPEADQVRVMGAVRLEALQTGAVPWSGLSTRRTTAGWRDSFAPTPVRALLPAAEAGRSRTHARAGGRW